MKRKPEKLLALLLTMVILFIYQSVPVAAAAEKPAESKTAEYSISIACSSTEYTTIGTNAVMNFNYAAQLAFKNYVESASEGKIAVNIYTNSSLGNASEILLQCMQGVIECSTAGDSDLSNYYPNIQVFTIPYAFENRAEFYEFLDGAYSQNMFDEIAKSTGVKIIAAFDNGGFRNFSNNIHQIHTADDLKGLKIRCMQSASYITTLETLGAVPTGLAFSELYSALQTGVVDGQENSPLVMLDNSIYEQQKYYTLDGHSISPAFIIVNEKWLRSLPDDLQQVVLDGGKIAQTAARGTIASTEGMALNFLNEKGVEIYTPTQEERETFKVAQQPVMEWLGSEIGDKAVSEFMDVLIEIEPADTQTVGTSVNVSGDRTNVVPYIVMIVLLVLALAVVLIKLKRTIKKYETNGII